MRIDTIGRPHLSISRRGEVNTKDHDKLYHKECFTNNILKRAAEKHATTDIELISVSLVKRNKTLFEILCLIQHE